MSLTRKEARHNAACTQKWTGGETQGPDRYAAPPAGHHGQVPGPPLWRCWCLPRSPPSSTSPGPRFWPRRPTRWPPGWMAMITNTGGHRFCLHRQNPADSAGHVPDFGRIQLCPGLADERRLPRSSAMTCAARSARRSTACPLAYFEKRTVGEVLSRITNDVDTLGQSLNQSVTTPDHQHHHPDRRADHDAVHQPRHDPDRRADSAGVGDSGAAGGPSSARSTSAPSRNTWAM